MRTVEALGVVKLFEHIGNTDKGNNVVLFIKLDNQLGVELHERNNAAGVAKSHVGGKAETESVEERENDYFRFLTRLMNFIYVSGLIRNLVDVFVGEHNGFAFSGGAAAVKINGDIRGIVCNAGNSFPSVPFNCGRVAYAVFELRKDCFKDTLAGAGCIFFNRSGIIRISAKQNGNAELVEGFNVIL